jgi:hypothetical protein
VVPAGGVAASGLAGSGAVPEPAGPALCPNADAVASIVAMATIVMVRICNALGMRHDGADAEIKRLGGSSRMNRVGPGISKFKVLGMSALISAHESCTLMKLLWQPLHCRNSWVEL